jgi:outer membrane receptor for ferrienterochelin and colicins
MAAVKIMRTVLLLALASLPITSYGGELSGRVTARETGEGLAGVTVLLVGTVRGTATDTSGSFRLTNVAPGRYAVMFSLVGYQRETRAGIDVGGDRPAIVNVVMTSAPVETNPIVVTASKREQSLAEVPVSVSVLDAADIERRNVLTIDQALRYVPGVNITGTQVNIRGSSGYSLGAGSRVLMLLDGIPFIAGDTGELNFESIPMEEIDRIEVVKGASSALYGSNALGGVINLITKPIPEGTSTTVRMFEGLYSRFPYPQWNWATNNRFFGGLSVTHLRRVGDLGLSVFFSHQADDGYRQNDYHHRYNLLVRTKETFSSASSLALNFGLSYEDAGQFLYWRNVDSALIPPLRHESDNEVSTRYFISGLYTKTLSDQALLTLKALWYHNNWGVEQTGDQARTESLADDFRLEVLSTLLVGETHALTLGLVGSLDRIGGDIFSSQTLGGFACYGQDEIRLSQPLRVTVGARFDFQSVGLTSDGGQLNPKVGITYDLFEGTTLRGSFGQGFRVPSLPEAFVSAGSSGLIAVPNKDLRPEKSTSVELGVVHRFAETASLDVAAFQSEIENLIEPGLIVSGTDLEVQWRNVSHARIQGVETSLNLALFDGLVTSGLGYTYVYPQDLTAHQLLKYRPRHVLTVNAKTQVGWFMASADFRYVSRVDRIDDELVLAGVIPDGDARVPIYVTDARIGGQFSLGSTRYTINFIVNNLFQHRYVELIGNVMPPRNYVLVIQANV